MGFMAAAILGSGALSAGSSLIGGGKAADAASKAAQLQLQAQRESIDFQRGVLQQIQAYVDPFITMGREGIGNLKDVVSQISQPLDTSGVQTTWTPDMATLEKMPGYQFVLQQGLKAVQGASGALGQGRGGPTQQAAINYAENAATTNEQNAFQQWLSQQQLKQNNLQLALTGRSQQLGAAEAPLQLGSNYLGAGLQGSQSSIQGIASGTANLGTIAGSGVVGATNALNQGFGGVAQAGQTAVSNLLGLQFANRFAPNLGSTPQATGTITDVSGITGQPQLTETTTVPT